ncbi:MAG: DUF4954 family protein [Prevotellaceae bacterium]|jgi:hypothetical protein|nr:DUF4954 family protein [Prevotellaceae bacterium]
MRLLTEKEIATLVVYGCTAENWKNIEVADDFSPNFVSNVHFSGAIKLGKFEKIFELNGTVQRHFGIFNCHLHNCSIADNVYINKINNYIANYDIADGAYIENVNSIGTNGISTFGNGVKIAVVNEGGGREIPIFNELSAPLAYLLAFYRHKTKFINTVEQKISDYAKNQSSDKGKIGANAKIVNCGKIENINIGEFAQLDGVSSLQNGSINSNENAKTIIGNNVIASDFIVLSGAKIAGGAILERCFVGQATHIDKQFSAVDSAFFANCQLFHGESCSVFAAPYTVSHHKATLLIAGYYAFFNAGSAANNSNHLYKLGAVHQGVLERGAKLASNAYLLFPAKIGCFTTVLGAHKTHFDTSKLPFSVLSAENEKSHLIPAANLKSVGTQRDAQKWAQRDNRTAHKIDPVNFELFNPYSIGKINEAIELLSDLIDKKADADNFIYKNVFVKKAAAQKGLETYIAALEVFVAQQIIAHCAENNPNHLLQLFNTKAEIGRGEWLDLAGLLAPQNEIETLISSVELGELSLNEIQTKLNEFYQKSAEYTWTWTVEILEKYLNKKSADFTKEEILRWLESALKSEKTLTATWLSDAKKEFAEQMKTGYTNAADFDAVRGTYDAHLFVKTLIENSEKFQKDTMKLIESVKN